MPSVDIRLCPEERKALLTSPIAMRRHVLNEDYWTRDVPWPGDATRFVMCEPCDGSGRELEWVPDTHTDPGYYEPGERRCRYCEGTGEEEIQTEPVTEFDMDALRALEGSEPDAAARDRRRVTELGKESE